jgi:hypothetical protein
MPRVWGLEPGGDGEVLRESAPIEARVKHHHVRVHRDAAAPTHLYVCMRVYDCMNAGFYVGINVCVHVCMRVHVCMYVCMHA